MSKTPLTQQQNNLSKKLFEATIAGTKDACDKLAVILSNQGVSSFEELSAYKQDDINDLKGLSKIQMIKLFNKSRTSSETSAPASARAPAAAGAASLPANSSPTSKETRVELSTQADKSADTSSINSLEELNQSTSASASASAPASARAPATTSTEESRKKQVQAKQTKNSSSEPDRTTSRAPANTSPTSKETRVELLTQADKSANTSSINSLEELNQSTSASKLVEEADDKDPLTMLETSVKNAVNSKLPAPAPSPAPSPAPASAPASAQRGTPASALQALLSESSDCPEKNIVVNVLSLFTGSENLSEKPRTKGPKTNELSSIVPYFPVFKKPVLLTEEEFEIIKFQMKESMDNAGITGRRGIELAGNIRMIQEKFRSDPNEENAEKIRTGLQTLENSFEDLKKSYLEQKAKFFKLKDQYTPEPDSLSSDEISQIQKFRQYEHVSSVVSSIQSLFNHLNSSQEGMRKGTAIMDTATPSITVYPNDKGPSSRLTREKYLELREVELVLFLREACKKHRLFEDILSVDLQKKTGKYYVKVSSNGDFNLVPSPENIIRWTLHFFSVVQDILSEYNQKNRTSHKINDVLESCKSKLFTNVFREFKPESKMCPQRHSGPKDMFSGIFDGACAVSESSQTRGGGAVAGGGRSAQSGSSATDIDSIIRQWTKSMGNVSNRPLAQIATHPSSEDSIQFYKAIQEHSTFKESGKKTVAKFLAERGVIRIDGEKTSATFTVISK